MILLAYILHPIPNHCITMDGPTHRLLAQQKQSGTHKVHGLTMVLIPLRSQAGPTAELLPLCRRTSSFLKTNCSPCQLLVCVTSLPPHICSPGRRRQHACTGENDVFSRSRRTTTSEEWVLVCHRILGKIRQGNSSARGRIEATGICRSPTEPRF